MAIGAGSLIEVSIGGTMFNQLWMNNWTYEVAGELGGPTAANWGQAIWDAIKTPYRALVANIYGAAFQFVKVREMDSLTGEYGEYAIPAAEQGGTGGTSTVSYEATFVAAGVKLVVATRVTRPGQKRIPGARAEDSNSSMWQPAYVTKLNTFMNAVLTMGTLGSPALGSEAHLAVVRVDRETGLPTAHQPVVGYLVNPAQTSQVSRKLGVGA